MSYKCKRCGHLFDECEIYIWTESHGEKFGACPICHGEFEKTKKCKICRGEFLEDELNGGEICDDCISDYYKDFDTCYNFAKDEKENVKISTIFIHLIGEDNIENVLYHYLKCQKEIDCSQFINDDKDWFAEKLLKEVIGSENAEV